MNGSITRRALGGAVVAVAASAPSLSQAAGDRWAERFAAVERKTGGRLGAMVIDTRTGASVGQRTTERFPMCSSFKWLLAAHVLTRVDAGHERLDRMIPYTAADLLEYAPIARANVAKGALSIQDLCSGAVELSDNTCANLLLAQIGGPAVLTQWLRTVGDRETRLDRNEPSLNSSIPGDPRDTTTPRAMLGSVRTVLLGKVLKPASRERLTGWLVDCKTGKSRIRAGLPTTWRVGDKTGTGGAPWYSTNDVAIGWPPNRPPVLVFAYLAEATKASAEARDGALAEVGKIAAEWAGG